MPLYLVQCRYTPEAWKGFLAKPEDRTKLAKDVCAAYGGTLHHLYFAFGEYDLVELIEAPDNETMMAILMASASAGSLIDMKTTVLMEPSGAAQAMTKAGAEAPVYRPPGQETA
jgi:uncharacterized protein with GYD domain